MKILTFLHSFEPGGVERVALRLVTAWRQAGFDAPLFMGREEGALRPEFAAELDYATPAQLRFGSSWWETVWMIVHLPSEIRRQRPDVLFCAGSTYTIVALAVKLLLGRRCPPIVAKISNDLMREDLPWPARICWRGWLRLLTFFVDHWITMDRALLGDVRLMLGRVPCTVVPDPAIDDAQLSLATPGLKSGNCRHFVAIGRLVAQKNLDLLLGAFADGADAHDRLTIYGDGPLRGALERRASGLGLGHRVLFAGHVANASSRLRSGDIFILSSEYEGVPAVLVEALAKGLSIVATDAGPGVRALLQDGAFGLIVPRGQVDRLAVAIRMASHNPIDPAGAQAHAASFTLERGAALYLDVFRLLIGEAVPVRSDAGLSCRQLERPRVAA